MFAFGANRIVNITPADVKQRLEAGEKPLLIDVREPWEHAEGHIPGSILHPLGQIRAWSGALNKQDEIIVYCRTASRSVGAAQYLQAMGFKNVKNMSGGIIFWRGAVAR
ncbi:MAG TPA: rhodanese-like domain-containing protein [Symbiobacteriaceae bacterium]|jgi:rhodanese-related sulfurtransferase